MSIHDAHPRRHTSGAAAPEEDRRAHKRLPATFAAEITDVSSGAQFTTRTNDVSLGGCFVDTLSPLPIASRVKVTLAREGKQFEARGTVIYAQRGLGMGIAFQHVTPECRRILDGWLAHEMATNVRFGTAEGEPRRATVRGASETSLGKLVQMLVDRGVLEEQEASEIMTEPKPKG